MSRSGRVFGVLIATFILTTSQGEPARAQVPLPAAVIAAAAERATFGLPSDTATVSALLGSGQDVGSGRWGIPMTADEEKSVDLPARMTFAQQAKEAAIPLARRLPDFAGVYFDQADRGKLVVLVVGGGEETDRQAIAALLPAGSPGVEFRTAQNSFAQLYSAWATANKSWTGDVPLLATRIEERANIVWLEVAASDLSATSGLAEKLSSQWGVAVGIRAAESGEDATCTSRTNCINPMKAGILVDNGENICTMGFHVSNGSGDVDKQWVRALRIPIQRQLVSLGHAR
jgi:hypothetical protein